MFAMFQVAGGGHCGWNRGCKLERNRRRNQEKEGTWVGEGTDAILSTSAFTQCGVGSPGGL